MSSVVAAETTVFTAGRATTAITVVRGDERIEASKVNDYLQGDQGE